MSIAGIVLAAGSSLRMGEPKQLLRYQGKTLLNHVIATAEASRLDDVVVVIGANAQAIEDSIETDRATVVFNPDFQQRNMASVAVGARAVDAEAYLTLPVDMPQITTDVIDTVIDRWTVDAPWAALTDYENRASHPYLLSRAAVDEAADTEGPKVLWRLLSYDDSGRVARIGISGPAPLDVNTPADFAALLIDD